MEIPLHAADLRGLSRLAIDGVAGVVGIVEAMHDTIALRQPGSGGITGLAYGAVRGTTRLTGRGLDLLGTFLPPAPADSTPKRDAWIAALNGVFGDHLEATANPLAIPMAWRVAGRPADIARLPASPRALVLVHGLAMNDRQWLREGHDHGRMLAQEAGFTPVYLHYNTGRSVALNGQALSDRLDELLAQWPVPLEDLVIVAHSMGGLVARSACLAGEGHPWRRQMRALVCLGTPHHGAPLERGGRLIDAALGVSPYAAPLARIGQVRSAGITDLRHGNVQPAAKAPAKSSRAGDTRAPTPLPEGVACSFVAATLSDDAHGRRSRLLGDGLVPVPSALGDHRDPAMALKVPPQHRLVLPRANHWDLLNHPEVAAALRRWLA